MNNGTALLVIDMQLGNFEEAAPVHNGRNLISKIGALIARARVVDVPIIYVQHCGPEGAIDHPGTPGWEIHPDITPNESDTIVQKHHPDAFQDTSMQEELKSRHVQRLIITGIQTEYCIDTTCRRAYSLNYEVILVKDAHSTWDSDLFIAPQIITHHNQVLDGWFVTLKEAHEIDFGPTD
jgi:nicotinamidase-related amidase